jgi:hypothetical protein
MSAMSFDRFQFDDFGLKRRGRNVIPKEFGSVP